MTISCPVSQCSHIPRAEPWSRTHLEALRVPLLHFLYTWHLCQAVREALELDHAVREPDGQLLRQELGRFEQGALGGLLSEENHLLQGDYGERGSAVLQ